MKMTVPDFSYWKPDSRSSLFVDLEKGILCHTDYNFAHKYANNWFGTLLRYISMDGLAVGEEVDVFERKVSIWKKWNLVGEPAESKSFAICDKGNWFIFPNREYEVVVVRIEDSQNPERVIAYRLKVRHRLKKSLALEIAVARK